MTLDRKFLVTSLAFAVVGLIVGIYMAASNNHAPFVAHAHILLVGFVLSFIYALIHRLFIAAGTHKAATVQYWLHTLAAVVMGVGLMIWYTGTSNAPALEKVLAVSANAVLLGMLIMVYLVIKFPRAAA